MKMRFVVTMALEKKVRSSGLSTPEAVEQQQDDRLSGWAPFLCGFPELRASSGHIVLLGDSIFDNAAYVGRGPDVVTQPEQPSPQVGKRHSKQSTVLRQRMFSISCPACPPTQVM
jgi:hypothetical protein